MNTLDKVSEILKAVKYIEDFLETDGQYLEDLLYLTRGNQLYTEDGDELYIDPTSQKRTLHKPIWTWFYWSKG